MLVYLSSPGRQVAVHKVERLQVAHSRGHLRGHVHQGAEAEAPLVLLLLLPAQELAQVAVLKVLHGHQEVGRVGRRGAGAHAKHTRQVGILQHGEEPHLADELGTENKEERMRAFIIPSTVLVIY